MVVFFMGDCIYRNIGGSHRYWAKTDNLLTIDVVASGILGLVVGVGVCVSYEMRQRSSKADSKKPKD
jgi:hypothetical protein